MSPLSHTLCKPRIEKLTFTNFTHLSERELLTVLEWRNRPEIREHMTHAGVITPEEHLSFCKTLPEREDLLYLRIDVNGIPSGVSSSRFDFKHRIIEPGVYYVAFPYAAAKVGMVLSYVYEAYGMREVRSAVKKDNVQALLFNALKTGSTISGENGDYVLLGTEVPLPYKSRLNLHPLHVEFHGVKRLGDPCILNFPLKETA